MDASHPRGGAEWTGDLELRVEAPGRWSLEGRLRMTVPKKNTMETITLESTTFGEGGAFLKSEHQVTNR